MTEDYQKLKVIPGWTTQIKLGGKPLDFDKYYDIKAPTGQSFEGCKVYKKTYEHRGYGGMSEDSTTINPFFEANGLEIRLQTDFLMRINEKVTAERQAEKATQEKAQRIKELSTERERLDREISDLSKNK